MHRGKYLKKEVDDSGIQKKVIAQKMGVTRQTLYKYFSKENLELEIILDIGILIKKPQIFDFVVQVLKTPNVSNVVEVESDYKQDSIKSLLLDIKKDNRKILDELAIIKKELR